MVCTSQNILITALTLSFFLVTMSILPLLVESLPPWGPITPTFRFTNPVTVVHMERSGLQKRVNSDLFKDTGALSEILFSPYSKK